MLFMSKCMLWSSACPFLLSFFFEFYKIFGLELLVFTPFLYLVGIPCFISGITWNVSTVGDSRPYLCLLSRQPCQKVIKDWARYLTNRIMWFLLQSYSV